MLLLLGMQTPAAKLSTARMAKAAQSIEHSGMIACTHEELLEQLDNPEQPETDDSTREGNTPPAEG